MRIGWYTPLPSPSRGWEKATENAKLRIRRQRMEKWLPPSTLTNLPAAVDFLYRDLGHLHHDLLLLLLLLNVAKDKPVSP